MKIEILMSVDFDHASPIEKADMYSATITTTKNDYGNGDAKSAVAAVIEKSCHFDFTQMTKLTNDGAAHTDTWTIWTYSNCTNNRNSVCFDANNLNDEMLNISFITGLDIKDINRIFSTLKEMREGYKFEYTIPDSDLEAN